MKILNLDSCDESDTTILYPSLSQDLNSVHLTLEFVDNDLSEPKAIVPDRISLVKWQEQYFVVVWSLLVVWKHL